MGSVWEAEPVAGGTAVAIKLLHPFGDSKLRSRFEQEAKTIERLDSPHVVQMQELCMDDARPFMVMELLRGEDLAARLKRDRKLSYAAVQPLARQIAEGLREAHDAGVVHRDLKPPNVFLVAREGADPLVKLLDFGIARTEAGAAAGLTTVGKALGSPYYMSPEQAAGRPVDRRADLWAFGVLLFRCLTGRRPFEGVEVGSVMVAIAKERPPRASTLEATLPAGTDAFFTRALRKDAQDRFQSAREMLDAFDALAPRPAAEVHAEQVVDAAALLPAPPPAEAASATPARDRPAPTPAAAASLGEPPAWKPIVHVVLVATVVLLCAGGYALAHRAEIRAFFAGSTDDPLPPVVVTEPPRITTIPKVELRGPGPPVTLPLDRAFIVNIWLEKCPDCMPAFEAWRDLSERSGVPDVPIVNVAYGRSDSAWAASYRVDQGLVFDGGNQLIKPLRVTQFTTLVVTPDGTIVFRESPTAPGFAARLAAAVEGARSGPPK